jgi:NAD-dependent dihydropyrimidine dehydrogenase PreA subunit
MNPEWFKWLPVIRAELCTGCGRCVEACGPRSLAIVDQVAVLLHPETCGSEEHCIAPCPEAAIRMEWVRWTLPGSDRNRGRWRNHFPAAVTRGPGREHAGGAQPPDLAPPRLPPPRP